MMLNRNPKGGMVATTHLDANLERLANMGLLEDNWNGYGAPRISPLVIDHGPAARHPPGWRGMQMRRPAAHTPGRRSVLKPCPKQATEEGLLLTRRSAAIPVATHLMLYALDALLEIKSADGI